MEKEKSSNFIQIEHYETIISESKRYLQISKPDFLGKSFWEFKHEHLLTVKISDEEWLNKFNNGEIPIKPGDVLEVNLKSKINYNEQSKCFVSSEIEVTKVFNVHHKPAYEYQVYEYTGNFQIKDWKSIADTKGFKKKKISIPAQVNQSKAKQSKSKNNGKRKK